MGVMWGPWRRARCIFSPWQLLWSPKLTRRNEAFVLGDDQIGGLSAFSSVLLFPEIFHFDTRIQPIPLFCNLHTLTILPKSTPWKTSQRVSCSTSRRITALQRLQSQFQRKAEKGGTFRADCSGRKKKKRKRKKVKPPFEETFCFICRNLPLLPDKFWIITPNSWRVWK